MSRRRFTEREVLECLVRQGAVIPCKRCGIAFTPETARTAEREHLHEIELGGPDTVGNCAYSHADCHSVITNGTPSTTAGSSKARIAKATNSKRIEKFKVVKTPIADQESIDPGAKCRACGEYETECTCPPKPERKSGFGSRPMGKAKVRA